jgi:hypothetical protein
MLRHNRHEANPAGSWHRPSGIVGCCRWMRCRRDRRHGGGHARDFARAAEFSGAVRRPVLARAAAADPPGTRLGGCPAAHVGHRPAQYRHRRLRPGRVSRRRVAQQPRNPTSLRFPRRRRPDADQRGTCACKNACIVRDIDLATVIRVIPPGARSTLTLRAPSQRIMDYCGRGVVGSVVDITPVKPDIAAVFARH